MAMGRMVFPAPSLLSAPTALKESDSALSIGTQYARVFPLPVDDATTAADGRLSVVFVRSAVATTRCTGVGSVYPRSTSLDASQLGAPTPSQSDAVKSTGTVVLGTAAAAASSAALCLLASTTLLISLASA